MRTCSQTNFLADFSKLQYGTVVTRKGLSKKKKNCFSQHGKLKDVRLVTYRNGSSKGLAYIEYENEVRLLAYIIPNFLFGGGFCL